MFDSLRRYFGADKTQDSFTPEDRSTYLQGVLGENLEDRAQRLNALADKKDAEEKAAAEKEAKRTESFRILFDGLDQVLQQDMSVVKEWGEKLKAAAVALPIQDTPPVRALLGEKQDEVWKSRPMTGKRDVGMEEKIHRAVGYIGSVSGYLERRANTVEAGGLYKKFNIPESVPRLPDSFLLSFDFMEQNKDVFGAGRTSRLESVVSARLALAGVVFDRAKKVAQEQEGGDVEVDAALLEKFLQYGSDIRKGAAGEYEGIALSEMSDLKPLISYWSYQNIGEGMLRYFLKQNNIPADKSLPYVLAFTAGQMADGVNDYPVSLSVGWVRDAVAGVPMGMHHFLGRQGTSDGVSVQSYIDTVARRLVDGRGAISSSPDVDILSARKRVGTDVLEYLEKFDTTEDKFLDVWSEISKQYAQQAGDTLAHEGIEMSLRGGGRRTAQALLTEGAAPIHETAQYAKSVVSASLALAQDRQPRSAAVPQAGVGEESEALRRVREQFGWNDSGGNVPPNDET